MINKDFARLRGRIEEISGTIVHGAGANKYSEPVHSDGRVDSFNPVCVCKQRPNTRTTTPRSKPASQSWISHRRRRNGSAAIRLSDCLTCLPRLQSRCAPSAYPGSRCSRRRPGASGYCANQPNPPGGVRSGRQYLATRVSTHVEVPLHRCDLRRFKASRDCAVKAA